MEQLPYETQCPAQHRGGAVPADASPALIAYLRLWGVLSWELPF